MRSKLPLAETLQHLPNAPTRVKLAVASLALGTLLVPIILSSYDYSTTQVFLAMVLLDVCLYPTLRYFVLRETGFPTLPMLCLAFAVQYSLPIFSQEPGISLTLNFRYLDDRDIVAALILSIVGICFLQMSYYWVRDKKALRAIPHINLPLKKRRAEVFCILVLGVSVLMGRLQSFVPSESVQQFSAVLNLLQNQMLVAIGILSWLVYGVSSGKAWHKVLLYLLVAMGAFKGFSSTMMESMMVPFAALFMTKWFYTKRFPLATLILIAVLFLFLSPVKMSVRSSISTTALTGSAEQTTDRAVGWVQEALGYWGEAFAGKRDLGETTSDASSRTDLIHTFAYIYSLTPSVIPYQFGDTYAYLAIAWIPRVIWPQKPQANYANNFYALAYEVSTEEGIQSSSFGATLMGEGYMNFGITGVILVMVFLGSILSMLEIVFAGGESGPGGSAVFVATFVYFLNGIGSSAELMFGGLVQNLVASCILLWWVRARRTARPTRESSSYAHTRDALSS